MSIRPGWFYHEAEDVQVKSVEQLVDIYFKTVGRNSNMLLNIPPNQDGLFSDIDIARLRDWRKVLNDIFGNDLLLNKSIQSSNTRLNLPEYNPQNCVDNNRNTFWVTDKKVLTAELIVDLGTPEKVNIIKLEEAIEYGQRIKSFSIYADKNEQWELITSGTTVGRTRLLMFDAVTTSKIKLSIDQALASPTLRTFSAFYYQK